MHQAEPAASASAEIPEGDPASMTLLLVVAVALSIAAVVRAALLLRLPDRDPSASWLLAAAGCLAFVEALTLAADWLVPVAPLSSTALGVTAVAASAVMLAAVEAAGRALRGHARAEHRLRETHDRSADLSRRLPVGVFHTDAEGRCVFVNERACEIARLPREKLFGTGWRDSVHPDDEERVFTAWQKAVASRGEFRAEFRMRGEGSPVWVLAQARPETDTDGGPLVYVGALIDITERRQFEQQLHEAREHLERRVAARTSHLIATNRELERQIGERQEAEAALIAGERRLRDILDNSTAIIYVKDRGGRYILINRQFARLFHTTREEAEGKTDFDLFPREHARRFRANDERVFASEVPMEFDESAPQDDGVHRYLSLKFPLYDAHGRVYAMCGISTDVTERERVQAERSRIFNLSPDLMAISGFDGHFKVVNPQFENTFGYSEAELLAMPFMELVHPDDREAVLAEYEAVKAGKPTIQFENRARCKDGAYKWISWRAVPVLEEQVIYTVGHDVTRQKQLEGEIRTRRAEMARNLRTQTMGEMAFGIAHELNQPLGAVVNYASGCIRRLASEHYDAGELRDALDKIATQGLRAGELIRRIREFVINDELEIARIDVNEVARNSARLLESAAPRPGPVRLELDASLPEIEADAMQLEQVLLNLLRNGIEAMDGVTDPELVLRTSRVDADTVEIAVTDRGQGLDDDVARRIFEPFFTTKTGGLGIGLAISRTIVEAHGGRLTAESGAGGGTTFRMTLPVSIAAAAPEAGSPGSDEASDRRRADSETEPGTRLGRAPIGRRHGAIGRRHGSIGRRHGPPDEESSGDPPAEV
jgi:PAS domain S-box-containing protein